MSDKYDQMAEDYRIANQAEIKYPSFEALLADAMRYCAAKLEEEENERDDYKREWETLGEVDCKEDGYRALIQRRIVEKGEK